MFFCDLRNGFLFKTFNWAFITSSPSGLVHHGDTVELTQQQHQRGFILFGLFMNCLPLAMLLVQIYLSGAREGSFLLKKCIGMFVLLPQFLSLAWQTAQIL